MAAGRGLNKGRGLGSLIPPKVTAEKSAQPEKKETPAEEKKAVKAAVKTTAKAAVKTTAKKAAAKKTAAVKNAAEKKSTTEKKATAAKKSESVTTEKENQARTESMIPTEEVISVRLTEVVPNHEQPRKRFDESGLEELAASIKEHGIVTPLLVQKKGKYYELIAGERRWRAAKLAGLKKVPVLLREFSAQQAAEIALIENIQRENLNAMEEAQAFKRLQDEFSLKQEEIAKRVSRSRSAITNSLRLLKLEEHVQTMLAEGKLSMGHARALLSLENPEMQKITAERVAESDLSVRDTEKLVKRLLTPAKTPEKHTQDEQLKAIYQDLEEQLKKAVGTKVSIRPLRGKKGSIEIEYYSDEDLERIIERLRQG